MIDAYRSASLLELKVFGAPRFLLNQRQIPFRRRQPLAIMAVLALSERPITRDELIYLLWPDTPQAVGRQRLRRLLSEIRQAIGSGADRFLSEAREGSYLLRFDPNECRVDAQAFLHLAQQARELADLDGLRAAEQALRLSTEPLLSGLELDASMEFEQWLFRQRERFARIQIDLWRRVVDGYVAIGDVNRALEAVVHALEIDPIAEDLHRRAIWLYAKAGRRTDAIHQYSHCAALLARELEIEPEADTVALYRAVLDDQPDDARALAFPIDPSRSETAALPASNRALTGVHLPDDALQCNELVTAIEQALTGAGAVCCIQGPAGAGKTRLVQMALERVRKDMPATPVWQTSARKTGYAIPFGLITSLFEAALQERLSRSHLQVRHTPLQVDLRMTEALCLLPELRAVFPALLPLQLPTSEVMTSPRMAQRRLLQALPRALRALQGNTPVVVLVEDVDQADPLSIEAIGWMLRTLPGSRMVIIITCRAADDALTEIRDQLRGRKGVQIWSLPALDRETIRQMVKQVDLPVTLAETVWQQTYGMPLATREMLRAALLARRTTGEARVPASLQEALFSRVQWLAPTTRQVLEAAAVLNGGSALWLHHVSGRTIEEVERACECLLTENWLTQVGTWYVIAHPEVQAVVLEHMSTARRHLLHRQAAALLRQYQADPFQIAVHLEAADQSDEAAAMWFQAACRAQSLSAHHAALAAIQRGLKLAVDRSLRFDLLSKQESILHDHGLRAEQETVLAALDHLVEQSPDHPEWRAEVYRKRGRLALAMNRWETAVDLLRRATALTLQQDVEILCLLVRALTHVRQWDEASACGQRALDLARQQNDHPIGFIPVIVDDAALPYAVLVFVMPGVVFQNQKWRQPSMRLHAHRPMKNSDSISGISTSVSRHLKRGPDHREETEVVDRRADRVQHVPGITRRLPVGRRSSRIPCEHIVVNRHIKDNRKDANPEEEQHPTQQRQSPVAAVTLMPQTYQRVERQQHRQGSNDNHTGWESVQRSDQPLLHSGVLGCSECAKGRDDSLLEGIEQAREQANPKRTHEMNDPDTSHNDPSLLTTFTIEAVQKS